MLTMPKRHYFGTDGIRGYVGKAPITPDFLVRLGFAVGKVLSASPSFSPSDNEVIISKDTRRSGYMVESALEAGLSAAGVNVLLCGPLPTSAVSYLTPALRLSAGIVISASHNPHYDNGVKFFAADGRKLADNTEAAIESVLAEKTPIQFNGEPGRARRLQAAAERYIEFCKRAFPASLNLRGLRIVVDSANGAAYHVAPALFHELGAHVISIGDQPDGTNINVNCGALAPDTAIQTVRRENADIGVVLDGDADRLQLIDNTGKLWDGDALLYLVAQSAAKRGKPLAGIVGTILSNLALERNLQALNVPFYRADVGDRYVDAALAERGWTVGGEPSGHILLRQFHQTGDGLIAALQALRVMRENDAPLSVLLKDFHPLPQETRNIAVKNHRQILHSPVLATEIKDINQTLGDNMRLIVRPSGTEPKLRIMVEGEDRQKMLMVINRLEGVLNKIA